VYHQDGLVAETKNNGESAGALIVPSSVHGDFEPGAISSARLPANFRAASAPGGKLVAIRRRNNGLEVPPAHNLIIISDMQKTLTS
jgi:hypothetical protein